MLERSDHRNLHRGLRLTDVRGIFLRPQGVGACARKLAKRRRKLLVERIAVTNVPPCGQRDLLLEQGVQDDGRTASVFEPPDGVKVIAERRSARHEWVWQAKTEV